MHRKSILVIIGGQNQVKAAKSHQVQIFKKCILEPLCTVKRHFGHRNSNSGQGHQRTSSAKVYVKFEKKHRYSISPMAHIVLKFSMLRIHAWL